MERKLIKSEAFVMEGKVLFVNPPRKPNAEKDFMVMEFGLDAGVVVNGTRYANTVGMQVSGDSIAKFEKLNVGDEIAVAFSVKGTMKTKAELAETPKNMKKEIIFTNVNAYEFEMIRAVVPVEPVADKAAEWKKVDETPAATPAASGVDDLPF